MVLLSLVVVAEERDGVGHHPDVPAAAVEVRLAPVAILVHGEDRVLAHGRLVVRRVEPIHHVTCEDTGNDKLCVNESEQKFLKI